MSEITNTIGVVAAAPFVPEIWSALYIDQYINNSVASGLVDRRFESDMKKGDTLHLGSITKVVPLSHTVNTDFTYNTNNEGWTNVSITNDYYIFRKLEKITKVQSIVDMLTAYTKMDAAAMTEKVDATVTATFDALHGGTRKGTIGVDVTDDNLIDCVTALTTNNVPMTDRAWIISPETWGSLMKIDKFVRLDYVNPSGKTTAIESAKLNYPIYGAPVYVSTNLEANAGNHNCALIQKEAIILIVQSEPTVKVAYDPRAGCDTILTECIWGLGEEREYNGICLQGK